MRVYQSMEQALKAQDEQEDKLKQMRILLLQYKIALILFAFMSLCFLAAILRLTDK